MRTRICARALTLALLLCTGAVGCEEDSGTSTETLFCQTPAGSCSNRLVELIDGADSNIQAAVFSFTHPDIANALARAAQRDVEVFFLIETQQVSENAQDLLDTMETAGVIVRLDGNSSSMHHKFGIIDQKIVATGSFNWTNNADFNNDENLQVFHDSGLANQFGDEFLRMWEEGD